MQRGRRRELGGKIKSWRFRGVHTAFFNRLRCLRDGGANAIEVGMSSIPIDNSSGYLQQILSAALQNSGQTTNTRGGVPNGAVASAIPPQSDNSQLSPFAQLLNTLQQLQQSDPTKYQQVTQQIATNLQSAAKTAQAAGNSTAAAELNKLAADFTNASTSGNLPSIQDLAQALAGGHHHHHAHAASGDSDGDSSAASSTSTTSTATSSGTNPSSQTLTQALAAFQANGSQSGAFNAMAIILNTLSSSGIGVTNS